MLAVTYELDNKFQHRKTTGRITKNYTNLDNLIKYGVIPFFSPYKVYKTIIYSDMVGGKIIDQFITNRSDWTT